MKKIYIASLLAATAITFVSAEDTKPMPNKGEMMRSSVEAKINAGVVQMMPTTGDATIDAQIKALSIEMETKIKALRDEYTIKIKAIVGNKKVTPPMGTTTPMMRGEPKKDDRKDDRKGDRRDVRKEDRPMMEGDATGTPQMGRGDGDMHTEMNTDLKQVMPQDVGARMKNFFRGFLGGNN